MSRLLLALALFTVAASAEAQTAPENPYEDKEWALVFSLDDFTLSSFSGGSVTVKRHRTPTRAWRASVGVGGEFSLRSGDIDRENRLFSERDGAITDESTSTTDGEIDGGQSILSARASLQHVRYFPSQRPLTFFTAIGPDLSVTHFGRKDDLDTQTDRTPNGQASQTELQSNSNATTRLEAGLLGSIGVEWFATPFLSFVAEYNVGGGYTYSREHNESTSSNRFIADPGAETTNVNANSRTVHSHGVRLGNPFARFGVSLYF